MIGGFTMKSCLRIAISTAIAVGVCAPLQAEVVPLFEATTITSSPVSVDIDNRFVFKSTTVDVYCDGVGTADVQSVGGGSPLVDNYMTAGNDLQSICTGGISDLPAPISGSHCFSSVSNWQGNVGNPMESAFTSTATAQVQLADGESEVEFKLWDYGGAYGNTALELALPDNCYANPDIRSMCAGQFMDVGNVVVTNDADSLYVFFEVLEPNWYLAETHVAAGEISVNNSGNPVPGKFPYSCELNGSLETECMVEIPLSDLGADVEEVEIAAHASVFELAGDGCGSATQMASEIVSAPEDQGLRNDDTPVLAQRSIPEAVYLAGDVDVDDEDYTGFYSLGFGGMLEVGFGFPVYNAPGMDVCIQEITIGRGSYPEESADVAGVSDEIATFADSVTSRAVPDGKACVDLDEDQMTADSVRITDTTFEPFPRNQADGYDIDWVGACYLYLGDETAWGAACGDGGDQIADKGNWATKFTYIIQSND